MSGRNGWTEAQLLFGIDETEMGPQGELRLRPPAVENLRRAVQLFTTQHTASKMVPMALRVHASQRREAGSQLLQPPAGEPQGHGVWVKELAPLDRPMVALRGLQLRARDLRCLAEALPGMQVGKLLPRLVCC